MKKRDEKLSEKISIGDIAIGEGSDFVNTPDIFKQNEFAKNMLNMVDGLDDGNNVLLLNGAWGTGKSIFIDKWANMAKGENYRVAYIDAFSNDYITDPFVVISAEIYRQILKETNGAETENNPFVEKAKKVAVLLAGNVVSGITNGIVDMKDIKDIIDGEFSDNESSIAITKEFKESLSEIAKEQEQKIIIVIDELDRCRPDFALRVLERIKHIFGVPNVFFVIVADKNRLADMVAHEYGFEKNNANLYLNKFFSFVESPDLTTAKGYLKLCSNGQIEGVSIEEISSAYKELERLCDIFNLSTRGLKRLLQDYFAVKFYAENSIFEVPLVGLCYLKLYNPVLFEKIKNSEETWEEICEALRVSDDYIKNMGHEYYSRSIYWRLFFGASGADAKVKDVITQIPNPQGRNFMEGEVRNISLNLLINRSGI